MTPGMTLHTLQMSKLQSHVALVLLPLGLVGSLVFIKPLSGEFSVWAAEALDFATRRAMCDELLEAVKNDNPMQNVFLSKEATFRTGEHVNTRSSRICHTTHEVLCRRGNETVHKRNVWFGIMRSTIYGPFIWTEQHLLEKNIKLLYGGTVFGAPDDIWWD